MALLQHEVYMCEDHLLTCHQPQGHPFSSYQWCPQQLQRPYHSCKSDCYIWKDVNNLAFGCSALVKQVITKHTLEVVGKPVYGVHPMLWHGPQAVEFPK